MQLSFLTSVKENSVYIIWLPWGWLKYIITYKGCWELIVTVRLTTQRGTWQSNGAHLGVSVRVFLENLHKAEKMRATWVMLQYKLRSLKKYRCKVGGHWACVFCSLPEWMCLFLHNTANCLQILYPLNTNCNKSSGRFLDLYLRLGLLHWSPFSDWDTTGFFVSTCTWLLTWGR